MNERYETFTLLIARISRIIRLIAAKMEAVPEVFGMTEGESEDEMH